MATYEPGPDGVLEAAARGVDDAVADAGAAGGVEAGAAAGGIEDAELAGEVVGNNAGEAVKRTGSGALSWTKA